MKRPICSTCHHPLTTCYCHTVRSVDNRWPVQILQHDKEQKHPLNTARIAQMSLQHCVTNVVTDNGDSAIDIDPDNALLIFPSNNALPLEQHKIKGGETLIFIDANWRKAKRIWHRYPQLQKLPTISLQPQQLSQYRIRKSPFSEGLSTVESIACLLGDLEHDHNKYQPLRDSMQWLIDRQIELMGEVVYQRNYLRADPKA